MLRARRLAVNLYPLKNTQITNHESTRESDMKRVVLPILLLLGCMPGAQADQDMWTDVSKPQRVNDTLQQDTDF
jgi:hypothetical protein